MKYKKGEEKYEKSTKKREIWQMKYKKVSKLEILVYIVIGVMVILGIKIFGCPIKFMTGISCPGCGMTRACISVFKGDFKESLRYNPMIILMPFMAILFVCNNIKPIYNKYKKVIDKLWVIIGTIFIVTYLIRLIIGNNDIVVIDIRENILFRIIEKIKVLW